MSLELYSAAVDDVFPAFTRRARAAIKFDRADQVALLGTYVLPIAAQTSQARALTGYLKRLSRTVDEVIVVDGSSEETFDAHRSAWSAHVRHMRPEMKTTNGKVAGVTTGVRAARHECIIIADDDVRYRRVQLARMLTALEDHEVVRPQNYFHPLPWHARWDTARSLLNRLSDGDWPGTLGVLRSALLQAGGYSGEVLFENLELVRTVRAAGGREAVLLDLFVKRRPPNTAHFFSQRIRQAYDEWARPRRLAAQLTILPAAIALLWQHPMWLMTVGAGAVGAAELGRRRGNGQSVYPPSSSFWVLGWLAERALTSWMALVTRLCLGGVRYRNTRLRNAASPTRILEQNAQIKAKRAQIQPFPPNVEISSIGQVTGRVE